MLSQTDAMHPTPTTQPTLTETQNGSTVRLMRMNPIVTGHYHYHGYDTKWLHAFSDCSLFFTHQPNMTVTQNT